MEYAQQVVFIITFGIFIYFLVGRIKKIKGNILLGRDQKRNENTPARWNTMLLVAFGQQKMFKQFIPAFFHFFIYFGFVVINIEVLEFILDGLAGSHRLFAPYLGALYSFLINFFEFLAVAILVSCAIFLIRRNILKVKRFWQPEMTSWPRLDGNLILVFEVVLMMAILSMNAADQLLQGNHAHYTSTGTLYFSAMLIPVFEGLEVNSLVMVERFAWWFHILGIFAFAVYITYSKHLHIFMSFPNTFYSNLNPKGKMENMPAITNEVKIMLGITTEESSSDQDPGRFGAKDVSDLSWKNLMDAYTCTECGRCTSACPANTTGKKLSPRKIIMDTRDRLEMEKKRG